jgi:hypothetical protein
MTISWLPDTGAPVGVLQLEYSSSSSTWGGTGRQMEFSCVDNASPLCVASNSTFGNYVTTVLGEFQANISSNAFSLSVSSPIARSSCFRQECALGYLTSNAMQGVSSCRVSIMSFKNHTGTDVAASSTLQWPNLRSLYPSDDGVITLLLYPKDLVDIVAIALQDDFIQIFGAIVHSNSRELTDVVINGSSVLSSTDPVLVCTTLELFNSWPTTLQHRIIYGATMWHLNVIDALYTYYLANPSFQFPVTSVFHNSSTLAAASGLCSYNDTLDTASFTDRCSGVRLNTDFSVTLVPAQVGSISMFIKAQLPDEGKAFVSKSLDLVPEVILTTQRTVAIIPFSPAYVRVVVPSKISDAGPYLEWKGHSTCPDGYVQSESNTCLPCAAGSYKNQTIVTNKCGVCPSGHYSSQGASICKLCPIGSYSAASGSPSCAPCPENQYQPFSGRSACFSCSAPRVRISNMTCLCSNENETYDDSSATCVSIGLSQSLATASALLTGSAAFLLFSVIVTFYLWSKVCASIVSFCFVNSAPGGIIMLTKYPFVNFTEKIKNSSQ